MLARACAHREGRQLAEVSLASARQLHGYLQLWDTFGVLRGMFMGCITRHLVSPTEHRSGKGMCSGIRGIVRLKTCLHGTATNGSAAKLVD